MCESSSSKDGHSATSQRASSRADKMMVFGDERRRALISSGVTSSGLIDSGPSLLRRVAARLEADAAKPTVAARRTDVSIHNDPTYEPSAKDTSSSEEEEADATPEWILRAADRLAATIVTERHGGEVGEVLISILG